MFFERPKSGELAVLVHVEFNHPSEPNDPREFEELALAAGADPLALVTANRDKPDAKYFVGTGKVEELQQMVADHEVELVIFNHTLSPSQERNLERVLKCRVLDRTGLILDIFAQRARTHEGKLQVELAQLQHMSTRLIRGWTHLERQKGGIGLRGPGETQLETDRRLLRARIKAITARLDKVRRTRAHGRRARLRNAMPTVSLVGYTNAGKSTLFNVLTEAEVYVKDQLFATLDPTMRRIELADIGACVLADTVGFISHLPHKLVEAFRATLEEASNADLLLHVVDCADPERERNIEEVHKVLAEIGADELPSLLVYNKIDLDPFSLPRIDRDDTGRPVAVWVSAKTGEGVALLTEVLSELLAVDLVDGRLLLTPAQAALRAKFYQQQAVVSEQFTDDGGSEVHLRIPKSDLLRILSNTNYRWSELRWAS
ncbi:ribosome rescue GTPase HflX [Halioxenophilus sp. WMMB6]|uniref:ribosome rescue GTPase HflX n=1 Tax=Halioxenophilus sp. WMMB6 TaxID=3073815 RepID=UPI00295EA232|nr:ribosome rescue GTPase HflX [Halioxenophilus sp. WMMB6]